MFVTNTPAFQHWQDKTRTEGGLTSHSRKPGRRSEVPKIRGTTRSCSWINTSLDNKHRTRSEAR